MYTQINSSYSCGIRRLLRSWSLFVLLALGFSQASAEIALNFGDSADFFLLTSNGSAGAVTWSEDPGVGGESGRVAVLLTANQANTMYYSSAIDPHTYALTASYYFLAGAFTANSNVSRIALGISTGTTDNFSGATAPIMARLIKNANTTSATFEIRSAAAGFSNTTGVTLTDGNWYKLTATFTPNAASGNYSVSATLEDYGADGLTLQSLVASASGTRNSTPTFFSDGEAVPVYFGFMAQDNGGGAIAVDNLTVPGTAVIPEPTAPAITTPPASQSVLAGANVTFSVVADGTGPMSYQWNKNGAGIDGATSASLTLDHVTAEDGGSYTVTVANSAGAVTSDMAVLTVTTPVAITTQPRSVAILTGSDYTLSVTATGTAPLAFQWKKDGEDFIGSTSSSLVLTNAQPTDSGVYAVVVTNAAGAVVSDGATVVVTDTATVPVIMTQPASQAAAFGSSLTLNVGICPRSTVPLTYQWTKDGAEISGATDTSLTLLNVGYGDAGSYRVTVSNSAGADTSDEAVITVDAVIPAIATQPAAQTAVVGSEVKFSVETTGAPAPVYQWFKNGVAIPGATEASYIIAAVTVGDAGSYTVAASNDAGTTVSDPAILTVNTATGHVVNLSVRAKAGTGDRVLIAGFVTVGDSKPFLLRGPVLAGTGVGGPLLDPQVAVYAAHGDLLTSNNEWDQTPNVADMIATATRIGASALPSGGHDAAVVTTLEAGVYTMHVSGVNSTTGVALAEVFDAAPEEAGQLVNVSGRCDVGTGDAIVIGGFVISGTEAHPMLLRGVGPGLTASGVAGVLTDPQLTLYRADRGNMQVAANDNWDANADEAASIVEVSSRVGAFPLEAGSKDAALLLTLEPGVYTVHLSGVNNTTGIGLMEIYDAAP